MRRASRSARCSRPFTPTRGSTARSTIDASAPVIARTTVPYKVRRFNWFVPEWPEPFNLQLNPDVTVRGAGVMEKCTFCIQRIQYAEINARRSRTARCATARSSPACAQACPTRAITFGDMKDTASAMMKRRAEQPVAQLPGARGAQYPPAIAYLRERVSREGESRKWQPPWKYRSPQLSRRRSRRASARWSRPVSPTGSGSGSASSLVGLAGDHVDASDLHGLGRHRTAPAHDVGGLHHELRFLGRNRAFGHAHLGDPVPVPHPLAHRGLSRGRDHDLVRGRDRRTVPADPSRARMVLLLAAALPE